MPVVTSCPLASSVNVPDRMRHLIRLLALCCEARLARPTAIEIALDIFRSQRNPWRTAVDHAAKRNAVALAKGRDAEEMAESVVGHVSARRVW